MKTNGRQPKKPYHELETIIVRLGEDRLKKVTEIHYLRHQNDELMTLLRSALWELAGANGAKSRTHFANDWMAQRRKRTI